MLETLKAMYHVFQSCVQGECGCSEYFVCTNNLKQECILIPLIFSILIQDIFTNVHRYGKNGVQFHPDTTELFILLFADDVVLLRDNILFL